MLYKSILPLSYYFSYSPFSNIFLNLSITLKFQPQFPFSSHRNLPSSLDNSSYLFAPNCIIRPGVCVSVWGGHSLAVGVTNGGKWDNLPTVSLPAMFFLEIYSWLSQEKKKQNLNIKKRCMSSVSCQCPVGSLFNRLTQNYLGQSTFLTLCLLLIKSPRLVKLFVNSFNPPGEIQTILCP